MTQTRTDVTVIVPTNQLMASLLGQRDEHLRQIEAAFPGTDILVRGNEIVVDGAEAARVGRCSRSSWCSSSRASTSTTSSLARSIDMVRADERPSEVLTDEVLRGAKGRAVRPKTAGQKRYIDAIRENVITFGIGPAGTGKSWLAVAMAVQALQAKEVQRIILTRPAVEAGERLGFLPGDLMAKVDPYLRPLYDALYDMVEPEGAQKLLERQTVEVAPLAFMRGRTLNNSFIILDEAQNTTPEQMKMFLTRIGFGSKVVVTGDTTQVDVQGGRSGLRRPGTDPHRHRRAGVRPPRRSADVVRHRIVADIVAAYERSPAARRRDHEARWVTAPDPDSAPRGSAATASPRCSAPTSRRRSRRHSTAGPPGRGGPRRRGRPRPRRAVAAVRRRGGDRRAERGVPGQGRPDRRARLPDRRRRGRGGRRRRRGTSRGPDRPPADPGDLPLLLGDVVVCPAVAAAPGPDARRHARRRAGPARRARRAPRARPRPRRARGAGRDAARASCELLEAHHWHGPAPAGFRQEHPDVIGRRSSAARSPSDARRHRRPAGRAGLPGGGRDGPRRG